MSSTSTEAASPDVSFRSRRATTAKSALPRTPNIVHKSKERPRLSTRELSYKVNKFFSPKLFPRGPDRSPSPPSLARSRLPPPCAELDEGPKFRVRRFKKWRDQVPELRMVLLDPKRRGHLIRYQTYSQPGCEGVRQRGTKRKAFPRGPEVTDYAKWPSVDSIRTTRRSHKATTAAEVAARTSARASLTPQRITPQPPMTGLQRKQERTRLKEHRWVLHAENERRWRQGMQQVMAEVLWFQDGCMLDSSHWVQGKGVWLPDFDVDEVKRLTNLFRDIRRHPSKVFDLSPTIAPVKGRAEADAAMKKNEAERKKRKADRKTQRDQTLELPRPTPRISMTPGCAPRPATSPAVSAATAVSPQTEPRELRQLKLVTPVAPGVIGPTETARPAGQKTPTSVSSREKREASVAAADPTTVRRARPSEEVRRARVRPGLGYLQDATFEHSKASHSCPRRQPTAESSIDRSHGFHIPPVYPAGTPCASTSSTTSGPTRHVSPNTPKAQPISAADQASLSRLLLQMSKLQTKRDDAGTPIFGSRKPSFEKKRRSSRPRHSAVVREGPSRSEQTHPTTKREQIVNSSGLRQIDDPKSTPSPNSSATTHHTVRPPRPCSLNIDDDTMAIDDDMLLTTPVSSAGTLPYSRPAEQKPDEYEYDFAVIDRYLRGLGITSDSTMDESEIYLSDDTGGEISAHTRSASNTFRSC